MPLVDKPLNELLVYEGCSPKPVDFDEYWDSSLAEMHSLDKNVVLEKAKFQAPTVDCYDLWFTGVGGARIHAHLLVPKNITGKVPAVVRFHGYWGHTEDFGKDLGLASQGFVVAALDCRGQGGYSEDVGGVYGNTLHGHIIRGLSDKDPKKLMYRQIYLDTAELAGIVMDLDYVDETRVASYGNSQGGALSLACAALEPRIAKVFTIHPFLCDFKRVWDMDMDERAYREIREYFRSFDPTHEHEDEIFYRLGYIDIQNLAPRIKGEVILTTGLMDNVCPPSTQFAAYNKITSKKSYVIYPDYNHEGLRGNEDRALSFFFELLK